MVAVIEVVIVVGVIELVINEVLNLIRVISIMLRHIVSPTTSLRISLINMLNIITTPSLVTV
jgi:hypothetical protein